MDGMCKSRDRVPGRAPGSRVVKHGRESVYLRWVLASGSRHRPLVILVFTIGVAWPLASAGCRRNEPSFEVFTLEGRIEKIDLTSDKTGEITVLYYSEKHGQDMTGTGLVTTETEIMINGALAELADLREGDRVRGEVRIDRKRGEKIQTALKIHVDRPQPAQAGGG